MNWPEDLIVGGIKRSKDDRSILHAEALQTVFLVASAGDVYNRFIVRYQSHKPLV